MRTIKTWLLTIAVLLYSITMNAYDFEVDGIYYNETSDSTVELTYKGNHPAVYVEYKGNITIPSTIVRYSKEYSVTSIGGSAFYDCDGLTSVTIGNSVTSIGDNAFSYCSGLTSITIPNSVTSIGKSAFSGSGLTSIVVEDGNSVYDSRNNCNAIIETATNTLHSGCKTTIIPNSVTSIGKSAFSGSSLTSVTIPNSVTSIGDKAFYYCSGLTSVTIPNSVTSIGDEAFYGCSALTSVHISDIAAWCNIDFGTSPSNPLFYADHLYLNGEEVKDLVIPNSVTSIGRWAFADCSGLTSVTIPNSVTSIGDKAFDGCSGLTSIVVEDENTVYDSRNNCNAIIETASNMLLCGCQTTVIPNSVTSIGEYAFYECKGLTSVTIPNSVESIGSSAFYGCSGLTSVTIGNSVTSIGDYAFYLCSALTSVTIGNSVTSIGDYAFYHCNRLAVVVNLSDLDISKGSTSHGYVAYSAKRVYNVDEMLGDYAFKESDGKNYLVRYVGDDKSITLPENYKDNNYNIGEEAFYGCGFLTSIVIPNSVQVIGNDAFYGCKLSSLTIGTGVRSIGSSSSESNKPKKVFWLPSRCPDGYKNLDGELNYVPNDQYYVSNRKIYPYLSSMFEVNNMKYVPVSPAERTCDLLDCIYDSLGSVVEIGETVSYKGIPMTVQNVGAQTFYGLKNIKEVYVSSSVQKSAFADCDSLTKVTFGDNAKIIGASAFEGCSSLSDVKIGTNVRSIEDNAFKDCSYLNNIEIADSVENIGVSAFSGCSSLSAIAIPQATETIKSSAFSGCSSLTNIIIEDRASKLTFGGKNVFDGCPLDSVYIGGKINGTPFSVNKSLRSVAFANNVDSIYAEEFYGCSNLKNVAMGDAVSSIGYQAFSGCSSLESFTFASAMKTIGGKAFSGCTSMTSLISLATTPPACGNQALDDIDKWSCVLKVPESSISAYQAADGWKEFFFIESLPTAITEVTEDENLRNATDVYTIGGMKVTSSGKLAKGIYIVDGKKVIVD